ncbi:VOC family protein [Amycolatopsis rhabdoformis]|uniref:VOC family protein n=1 Tax=Amycolatopsis rhabdoformis TaxID=1448059 RepID=A0ABZ1I151_9PSEU|nr:VOC family protein [Amycolatopsis rhabdoformis]WSE27379.1 VOC family protein [Amycolatopsis rhabdoformis]
MASPAKLSHVVLYSRQLPAMRDWYVNTLEGRVVHETPGLVFLTYDDEHHRIAIADPTTAIPDTEIADLVGAPKNDLTPEDLAELPLHGLAHVAFTYHSLQDLLETWERLDADGVQPVLAINHGPTTSVYYADPDGNQLELQIDNFPTTEEGTAFMQSESFARNSFGVVFDPAALLAELRAGKSQPELTVPTW